jgi:hypothetical protein
LRRNPNLGAIIGGFSLLVREYSPGDLDALRRMHSQQHFDYPFPDLDDPIFISKLVVEEKNGHVVMASLARLTCEIYLFVGYPNIDGDEVLRRAGKPRARYGRLMALHRAGEQDLLARGLDDAHAWLPPAISRSFGRRLGVLGWMRDDSWTPYCFRLRKS